MKVLTRLWQALARLTRTITIGQVAAAYVVALILGLVAFTFVQVAILASDARLTLGFQIVFWFCSALFWSAIILFLVATGAGVVRLVRSVAGK